MDGPHAATCRGPDPSVRVRLKMTPDTWAEKFESFERINSIPETSGSFDSCNSCKRQGTSRLHELHEWKLPFVLLSNLLVWNFRIVLLMYPWSLTGVRAERHGLGIVPPEYFPNQMIATRRATRHSKALEEMHLCILTRNFQIDLTCPARVSSNVSKSAVFKVAGYRDFEFSSAVITNPKILIKIRKATDWVNQVKGNLK